MTTLIFSTAALLTHITADNFGIMHVTGFGVLQFMQTALGTAIAEDSHSSLVISCKALVCQNLACVSLIVTACCFSRKLASVYRPAVVVVKTLLSKAGQYFYYPRQLRHSTPKSSPVRLAGALIAPQVHTRGLAAYQHKDTSLHA